MWARNPCKRRETTGTGEAAQRDAPGGWGGDAFLRGQLGAETLGLWSSKERFFIELTTSDRRLRVSGEGSK